MKRYNISEVAKILNVSSGLLRYYESIGLITPLRDGNGYRNYDIADIDMLLGIRRFRNIGFPLDDIDMLIDSGTYQEVKDAFSHRIDEIEKEIAWKTMLLESVRSIRSEIDGLEQTSGVYSEIVSPDVVRIESRKNDSFFLDIVNPETMKWVNCMPMVAISPLFSLDAILNGEKEVSFGFVVPYELSLRLGLNVTRGAVHVPSAPCVSTVIHSLGHERIHSAMLRDALDYIKEHGMEPISDPWGITIGNYNEHGEHKRFHRIFFPVLKK
ncbi:MerR family transcriptional regulator [Sediminispirochaeta bajacaliforniensis]|uniref:MerR family transcriptional regulator n=1 Tax=Sediminispirochaeta bajacaliforniensis TaxID=148 RepID=UPI00037D0FC3|nr:MerR family transcriptional regulator [Sediminispirochaeta bajacaliforniensis]